VDYCKPGRCSKKEDLKERGDCYFSVTRGAGEPTPHQTKTKSDKCSQIKGATQKDHRVLMQHIYLFCRAPALNDESDSSLRFFRSLSSLLCVCLHKEVCSIINACMWSNLMPGPRGESKRHFVSLVLTR